ncbi:MAG TPA: DUF935 family protein, partial [Candidatus Saccharimonadales bacterium]|nr:DUF935 family protein [Candidatus Saccharimonadales bacterium]
PPSPLQKPALVTRPSSLAYGLNQGAVVSVQNHWREFYNPLRALDLPRAIALYDFARRGLNAELQNVYREMEGLYPTLMALIERRTSPLLELEIEIKTTPIDQRPAQRGVSQTLADDQAAVLRDAYESIDNLYEAIEWLEMGAFRGYAHLEKIYANPGTSDWTVRHLEPVEQWHWTRSSMYAEWEYVAAATQTNMGVPINYEQFLIHEARRPLDRVALILWIRANLCEKDWDAFIEIYGVPHWIVFMPPNVPKEKESEYLTAARSIMQGGTGALPHGSEAKAADSPRDTNPFRPRLDWLQEQLVLAGTGGLLSMLALPTGLGHGASAAHDDAFKKISKKEARKVSEVFNAQFDAPLLARQFPGQPPLAYFTLAANQETNVGDFVDQTLKLAQAGYQVSPAQITEKTGYEVTLKSDPSNASL